MLSKDGIHSVRDSFTEQCLKDIGIKNVIETRRGLGYIMR